MRIIKTELLYIQNEYIAFEKWNFILTDGNKIEYWNEIGIPIGQVNYTFQNIENVR